MTNKKIALIRIRGMLGVRRDIKDTLHMLQLRSKNAMSIVPETPEFKGMISKVKDFVTYGEVDEATVKAVLDKRKNLTPESKIMSFRMHPPIGGFERKGIKVPFNQKGALGYRADKINDLIKKMM